jgi:outer membrane lipoprotein carrier protein
MRNRAILRTYAPALAALALALGLAPSVAPAQQKLGADKIAALVQSFYEQTKTIQADFYQTYYHKLYDRYERSKGKVVFKKPGQMRWDYAKPNGKKIVSNGDKLKIFDPGEESGTPQLFVHPIGEHSLPQAFSFLTGTGKLDEDFDFRLLDPERQGFEQGYVLELTPKEPTPHYERLLFYVVLVGSEGKQAGIVRRVLIVDEAGNRNRFDFSNLKFNRDVPNRRFNFQPPAGTRRVRP